MTKPIVELRARLTVTVRELADKDLNSRQIVAELRKDRSYRRLIAEATTELEDRALIKLIDEVSRRRPAPELVPGQFDLFAGYHIPGVVVLRKERAGKVSYPRRKASGLQVGEAEQWVKDHTAKRDDISKEVAEMDRLLDDVRPYVTSPKMTIEEALAAKRTAEERKKKSGST